MNLRKILFILSGALLLLNGIGALYGGWSLMSHPNGSAIQLPMEYLRDSPFRDYFIPGIILFTVNGLLSLLIFVGILFKIKKVPYWIMAQGAILMGWIVIQMILIQQIYFLQYFFFSIGLLLLWMGWKLRILVYAM